jgi:hypothetical protein
MKKKTSLLMLLPLLLPLISCDKDGPPPPPAPDYASSIEGLWVDLLGTFAPDWHYHFEAGLLTQHYIKAGDTLSELSYPYAVRDSTIIIGGDINNAPREWHVLFECEDVVQVTQYSGILGKRFWLRREE